MTNNPIHFPVKCGVCGLELVIDITDNTKQEVSEHLKACIPNLQYPKISDYHKDKYTLEIPYSKMTIEEFKCLNNAVYDADRQIVIIEMI